ncbi:hypothetical protein DWV12_14605 [Clostridium botulinum]|uniref:hypothetical protein n=1 Tax=Clostridium botulinum TaxID=1491 RepID=UPI00217DF0EE|nr:hypothetical protein [Clostridium botulinum]MCS6103540.1 hypothetical protein [Clostridium botulinum]MCS6108577.1 hypothetical protein [Clostridium botulinum]
MNNFYDGYIDLEECIEFLQSETIIKGNLTNLKSKLIYKIRKGIFGEKIIFHNDSFYIYKSYVIQSIELYKKSIDLTKAINIIQNYDNEKIKYVNRKVIEPKCKIYIIPLIEERRYYISKDDLNNILKGIDSVSKKDCITSKEFLLKMKKLFKGFNFSQSSKLIFKFIRDNDLEVIRQDNIGNFYTPIKNLYPKTTVDKVIENLKFLCKESFVKTINMSFDDYFNLSEEDFKSRFKKLSIEDFNNISGNCDSNINLIKFIRFFKDTKVKCFTIIQKGVYVSIKEYNELLQYKNDKLSSKKYIGKNSDLRANELIINNYKEKLKLKEQRIDINHEQYILLKEYIYILYEATGIYIEFARISPRFKKMYDEGCVGENIILYKEKIYLNKKWVLESIELYKKSVYVFEAIKIIKKNINYKVQGITSDAIMGHNKVYKIPLINRNLFFISKECLKSTINGIKEVNNKQCINKEQLFELLDNRYKGIKVTKYSKIVFSIIKEKNLEKINKGYFGYFSNLNFVLYPKNTIEKILESLDEWCEEKVKLINLTFQEYYNIPKEDFDEDYIILTINEFNMISGMKDEEIDITKLVTFFKETNVKCIFIDLRNVYVSQKEYSELRRKNTQLEKFINIKKESFDSNEELSEKYIDKTRLLKNINSSFMGVDFGNTSKLIFKFINDNKLKVYTGEELGKYYEGNKKFYPKETIEKVVENIKKQCKEYLVKLINLSYEEYYNLSYYEFKRDYRKIDNNEFAEISGHVNFNERFRNCARIFKDSDVKCIWIHKKGIYVSIKECEKFLDFKDNYVCITDLREKEIDVKGFVKILGNYNFEKIFYKQKYYISKKEVPRFIKIRNYITDLDKKNNIYGKFMMKLEYFDDSRKNKYKKFTDIYIKFVKYLNIKNRLNTINSRLFKAFKLLLDCLEKDLLPENKIENNKMFEKALFLSKNSVNTRNTIIQFSNYLINNKGFDTFKIINNKQSIPLPIYDQEQFIKLLIKLIDIIADKENIKKLYRNWSLSSAVTYIFLHYTLAWRKMDLFDKLSLPILQNIEGITDGESFIKWLEEGNEITDRIALSICEDLEEQTRRLNLKASKNDQRLSCVISSNLSREVALLLCICESNRQIYAAKKNKVGMYYNIFKSTNIIEPKRLQLIIKQSFDIDIKEILDGGFDNRRMNKSFMSLVKEKAEELGLAYSYYYAQVSRGHKGGFGLLSETTKIYLNKDINKASLMAFSMGTMGSVVHIILELVSNNYKGKTFDEQIELQNSLGLTPYTLEKNIEKITNKITVMQKEIDTYFQSGGVKDEFLRRLLYGQSFYGNNQRTKCLLKITRTNDCGIKRIQCKNNRANDNIIECPQKRDSCIGCDYIISLRYFIFEFEKKFNYIIDKLEKCTYDLDKKILIYSINKSYIPLLNDLSIILGEEVKKIVDTNRYMAVVKKYGEI